MRIDVLEEFYNDRHCFMMGFISSLVSKNYDGNFIEGKTLNSVFMGNHEKGGPPGSSICSVYGRLISIFSKNSCHENLVLNHGL